MAESRYEQIVEVLKDAIGSIVGDGGGTYWHTYAAPSGRTISAAGMTESMLGGGLQTLVVIIPDNTAKSRDSNRTHWAEAHLDVVACVRLEGDDPFVPPDPSRQTLQSRLAQDIERALMADATLDAFRGLEVVDRKVVSEDRSPEATWDPTWAMVITRLAITYRYRPEVP